MGLYCPLAQKKKVNPKRRTQNVKKERGETLRGNRRNTLINLVHTREKMRKDQGKRQETVEKPAKHKNEVIFQFVNSNENNFIYLLLTRGRKKMDFDQNCLLRKFQPSQIVCTPRSRRCKTRCSRKTVCANDNQRVIGLCRVSIMQSMDFLDKKLTGPGPEISVDPGVTLFLFFVVFACALSEILPIVNLRHATTRI